MERSRWDLAALQKLTRVLGETMAEDVFAATLREIGLSRLETANDLYRFAQQVIKMGGFVGAVGGLLSVHSVIHGATET